MPGYTLAFVNGGFEQGLTNWQKFGGELATTGSPRRSGEAAGVLRSATDSTKWAYQTIAVTPGRYYEFAGYVQTGEGVSAAYLRISWYSSTDGTGSAAATDDSLQSLGALSGAFVFLTTGPVEAPAGARSARARVLLTPSSASEAAVYLDDFSFTETDAPAATATTPPGATSTVPPDATTSGSVRQSAGGLETEPTPRARATTAAAATTPPTRSVTPAAGASGTGTGPAGNAAQVRREQPAVRETERDDGDEGVPILWLAATALFAVGLAGAYFKSRGR